MKVRYWMGFTLSVICFGSLVRPALAQKEATADTLFEKGRELLKAGLYAEACPMLEDSYNLDQTSATALFMLAECRSLEGKIATAVQHYEAYLRMVEKWPTAKRLKQEQLGRISKSKAQIEALKGQIPQVSLKLAADVPAGTRMERDGVELSLTSLSVALPVDPGEHLVKVMVPGREVVETRFTIERNQIKTVEVVIPKVETLPVPPMPVIAVPPGPVELNPAIPHADPPRDMSKTRIGAYAAGGVGLLGLAAGAVFGVMTMSRGKALTERCPVNEGSGNRICSDAGDGRELERLHTFGTLSTVGLAVGGTALAGAGVLWLMDPQSKEMGFGDMSGRRLGAHAAIGVGLLGLGAGAALGGYVLSEADLLLEQCSQDGTKLVCPREVDRDTGQRAQTLGTVSTVSLAVGGAAVAGGVLLWLLEPKAKRGASALRLETVHVDSRGGFVGVKGEW